MQSVVLSLITGMKPSIMGLFPTPVMPAPHTNGPLLTEPMIIAAVVFVLAVIFPVTISALRKVGLRSNQRKYINEYEPTANHDPSFEDKLKAAKLKPQHVIVFGTNRIAIDNVKKRLFIRSSKEIDGVLLNFKDIVSYEVIKDGNSVARNGSGFAGRASAGESGIYCSDLRLVITTNKQTDPEVVLPFIAFSIDSKFAYNEALDAAKEAAQALDRIIV